MSGGTKKTQKQRKPDPARDEDAETHGAEVFSEFQTKLMTSTTQAINKRKSTRMSTKPKLYDADVSNIPLSFCKNVFFLTRKVSPPPSTKPRCPKAEEVFEVEKTDKFSDDDNVKISITLNNSNFGFQIAPTSSLIGKKQLLLSPGSALAGKVRELSVSES